MDKERTPRQDALLDYLRFYMMENAGRAPTLNNMLADKVGEHTDMGAYTSKSVLIYNLDRLDDRGDIERIPDGSARNIALPGGLYAVPFNKAMAVDWTWYEIILLDLDDFSECHLPESSLAWFKSVLDDDNKMIFTVSRRENKVDAWDRIEARHDYHIEKNRPHEVINEIVHQGFYSDVIAMVTNQYGMRLAALGFGLGLFDHQEVHGAEPARIDRPSDE